MTRGEHTSSRGVAIDVLGQFEVSVDGQPIRLTAGRQRALLAALAVSPGKTVSMERLAQAVWSERPPRNVRRSLQTYAGRLRDALGAGPIETHRTGLVLHADPENVDALKFTRLLERSGDAPPSEEREHLVEALSLWRGEAFEGVDSRWLTEMEAPHLSERYLVALERLTDLDIADGRHGELVAELEAGVARHPTRETLWLRLLVVLDRCGRQAEALQRYEQIRQRLADELGVDPGPELQRAHQEVLAGRPLWHVEEPPSSVADSAPSLTRPPALPAATLPHCGTGERRTVERPGFGELPRGWRDRALLTQDHVAERSGLAARTVRRLDGGVSPRPHVGSVRLLAQAVKLDAEEQPVPSVPGLASDNGEPAATWARPMSRNGTDMVPRQAPADVASFVGRERELAVIEADCESGAEILMIDGMPGIGKTALAVHAAHRLTPRFPDGVLFADLHGYTSDRAPLDAGEVLGRFMRSLELAEERIPRLTDDRAATYRTALAGRRTLVVLDNALSEEQVRPLLPGPGCTVLITSRNRLAGLERTNTVTLGGLSPYAALDLFAASAGKDRLIGTDLRVMERVVRSCALLPLALYVAGARLRSHPAWSVLDLLDRLEGPGQRLAELEVGERSVAGAFDTSYRRLTSDQQRAYRLLSGLSQAQFDAHAAASELALDVVEAKRVVDRLVGVHLLEEPVAGRYRFHDLVRDHTAEQEHTPAEH